MTSFTKRNGRWRARVGRVDLPPLTKSFPTKALALEWSQKVESNSERFFTEQLTDVQLKTLGDLVRKYGKEVTPKRQREIQDHSSLSSIPLKELRLPHITQFREERLRTISAGTVLKDLGLLSVTINTGRTEWGLENVIRNNPVSLISKPNSPRPRGR